MTTDYTSLSLADLASELDAIAQAAQSLFGRLDGRQLNWKPNAASWSVAQCFDHLLSTNREMFQAVAAALEAGRPRTVWQRLPVLPRIFGTLMIRSQGPQVNLKFTAPRKSTPVSSTIDPQIIGCFVAHQREAVARVRSLEEVDVARAIMISPFVPVITYSVLDACRLIVAHERRHCEQARRVTERAEFPPPA